MNLLKVEKLIDSWEKSVFVSSIQQVSEAGWSHLVPNMWIGIFWAETINWIQQLERAYWVKLEKKGFNKCA